MYHWSREVPHFEFLDMCHKYGLMVIVTFPMDAGVYPDLTDLDVTSQVPLGANVYVCGKCAKRGPGLSLKSQIFFC